MPYARKIVNLKRDRPSYQEFIESFKIVNFIGQMVGLSPNEVREVNGSLEIRKCVFVRMLTVTLTAFYSWSVFYHASNPVMSNHYKGVSRFLDTMGLIVLEMTFYTILLSVTVKQKYFLEISKDILKVDILLFQLGERVNYKKEFQINLITIGVLLTTMICVYTIQYLNYYQSNIPYTVHAALWIVPSIMMFTMLLQFSIIVYSLKLRSSKLNNYVSKIIKSATKSNLSVIPYIDHDYENSRFTHDTLDNRVWDVSVIYDLICEITKAVNESYSLTVTVSLISSCIFIAVGTYFIIPCMKDSVDLCQWTILLGNCLGILLQLLSIFMVTYCCNGAQDETNQVAVLVHKINAKIPEHRTAINTFSLQSLHQKVQFTACGLFSIDYTFIYLVLSTVITYMVILMQFDQH
ncbi:gustatory receptor 68a-like [Athalia rosae]|uniref:gustatory receptor 68a-like n=1 Tax=Athalia rosae TaxID=37344 RepID=UPI0020348C02|nr:gustatory receptor 68a-like [Athalia rosae]